MDLYSTPWSYCNADFIYNLEKLPTKMNLSLDMNFLSVPIISSDHGAHVHQWPWGWKVNRCPIILSAIFQQSRNSLYRLAYKVIFVKPSGAIFVLVVHKSGHVKNTSEKQWLICKAHVWPVFFVLLCVVCTDTFHRLSLISPCLSLAKMETLRKAKRKYSLILSVCICIWRCANVCAR